MPPLKRALDLSVCIALAVPALIVTLIVLPFVWVDTRTAPLFLQKRVGRMGLPFTMLKLRTMRAGTPVGPSHEIGASAVTRSGHFLRRTKIDELPQLWNVFTGDMSLVGPRPCLPSQRELIEQRALRGVLSLHPGITGIAQVEGLDMRDPIILAERDAAYLRSPWSLRRDLLVLLRTAIGGGRGDAAAVRH